MRRLKVKILTAFRLGLINIAHVVFYRFSVRTGINPVRRLSAVAPVGPFFDGSMCAVEKTLPPRLRWYNTTEAFGCTLGDATEIPNWLAGCFSGKVPLGIDREWWQIPDFDPAVGDIKTIWEASRFDWVLACVQQHIAGDEAALQRLELWLSDWMTHNPPYKGHNWKCGQESSIRVMHLAIAVLMLGETRHCKASLLDLIQLHLMRIAPTVHYAMAQDNNHGTSEAGALFIGGSLLVENGNQKGAKWARTGRKWLENRAERLIEVDGSFSQHSLNYHRVMLDTFCMVERWRAELQLALFSVRFYQRAQVATDWLRAMLQSDTGEGPNLGANDGARLLQLTDTDYRDYRPSVQLASVLFKQARAYDGEGDWNLPLDWLNIERPAKVLPPVGSVQFDEGGYVILRRSSVMAMLRYPRYRFRPSHADALHLDLWLGGENWLRDAGSFSYNTDAKWMEYFSGTVAHNTVQFDGRDQMPRLSRFLRGDWLKTSVFTPLSCSIDQQSFEAGYRDGVGCEHSRNLLMRDRSLVVTDTISGFRERAVLRWRLRPGPWLINKKNQTLTLDNLTLMISADAPIKRFELVEGWESLYYSKKQPVPVLEIELIQPAEIISNFSWVIE